LSENWKACDDDNTSAHSESAIYCALTNALAFPELKSPDAVVSWIGGRVMVDDPEYLRMLATHYRDTYLRTLASHYQDTAEQAAVPANIELLRERANKFAKQADKIERD
jgi:hypothetical protein